MNNVSSYTSPENSDLFQPYTFGSLTLTNRLVMAPLTRSRAGPGDVPTSLMALYYSQRASAGLIISEGAQISPQGKGYIQTPGIYNQAQVAGWRQVTNAVHEKNGKIFIQLWHVGRISHPDLQINQALPVAPSAIRAQGQAFTERGMVDLVTPRALELAELPGLIADYQHAAELAQESGFDGVEIHAANGYLLDQFLRDQTNQRTDIYGGSIENRARFLLEITDAISAIWGAQRVGVRISPLSPLNDISDSNPESLFTYIASQLAMRKIGYLHVIEGVTGGARETGHPFQINQLRKIFNGTYIANNNYNLELALAARANNNTDLISFGRLFIANPDLVSRLRHNASLNPLDPTTLYGGAERGYTDYPVLADLE